MDSPFALLSTPVHLNETYGPCSPLFSSTPEMPLKSSVGVSKRFLLDLVQQQEVDLQEKNHHIQKLLAAVKERDAELENYDRLLDSHVLLQNILKKKDEEISGFRQDLARLHANVRIQECSQDQDHLNVVMVKKKIEATSKAYKASLSMKDRHRICQDYKYRLAQLEIKSLQDDRTSLFQKVKLLKEENDQLRRERLATDSSSSDVNPQL